jgi:hypothetical protein
MKKLLLHTIAFTALLSLGASQAMADRTSDRDAAAATATAPDGSGATADRTDAANQAAHPHRHRQHQAQPAATESLTSGNTARSDADVSRHRERHDPGPRKLIKSYMRSN